VQLFGALARDPRNESTDADGRYEAGGLPAHSYRVIASMTGYTTTEFDPPRENGAGNRSQSQATIVLSLGTGGDKLAPQFDHNLMEAQQ
jgi:hypothetical protein